MMDSTKEWKGSISALEPFPMVHRGEASTIPSNAGSTVTRCRAAFLILAAEYATRA